MSSSLLLPLPVLLPLLAGVSALLLPRLADFIGRLTALLTFAVMLYLALQFGLEAEPQMRLGSWPEGLAIRLQLDAVAMLFLLMSGLLYLLLSLYAARYFQGLAQCSDFWLLWGMLFAALHGLFISADLFNLYVGLELLSVSAVGLTLLSNSRAALQSAGRYLIVSLLGSLLFLAGVVVLIAELGTADIPLLTSQLQAGPQSWLAFLLMNAGLMLKAALFPVHFWLPATHAAAPAPVSAALSALVVKACLFLILRLWLELFFPMLNPTAVVLMGSLGAAAVLLGGWQALLAPRLKLLAAWSTVAQIGYLVLFIPLLYASRDTALFASLYGALLLMALSHGLAKSALFLAIGQIQRKFGHDQISRLQGFAALMPVTCFSFALAGVVLIGLPPGSGFLAKWWLISGAVAQQQWLYLAVIMLGTLLAAAYLFRVLSIAFTSASTSASRSAFTSDSTSDFTPSQPPTEVQIIWRDELPGLGLALCASLLLGLGANAIWGFIATAGGGV